MGNANNLSPSTLAFMGDAVYGLLVREKLCAVNRPSGELHSASVRYVSAAAQCAAFESIKDMLTEDELAIFKRGRNFHTSNTPKSSTAGQYHTATGLETLFGYLYLSGSNGRMLELFDIIWSGANE